MSRRNRFCSIARVATFDAVFVGSGINSLVGAALARPGRLERLRPRAQRPCRRLHPDLVRPDPAGLHPRGARVVAPPLHRVRGLRRAGRRTRTSRRHLRQHGPPDRSRVPRRLGRVRHGLARGQCGGVRPPRAGRRRRLGAPVRRVHGQRRSLVRACRRSSGRPRGSRSVARLSGGSAAAACSSSPAARSSAAATG